MTLPSSTDSSSKSPAAALPATHQRKYGASGQTLAEATAIAALASLPLPPAHPLSSSHPLPMRPRKCAASGATLAQAAATAAAAAAALPSSSSAVARASPPPARRHAGSDPAPVQAAAAAAAISSPSPAPAATPSDLKVQCASIALNQELRQATQMADLFSLWQSKKEKFDENNIITALYQLSKFSVREKLPSDQIPLVQEMLTAIQTKLHSVESHNLSHLAQALGTLKLNPQPQPLIDAIFVVATQRLDEKNSGQTLAHLSQIVKHLPLPPVALYKKIAQLATRLENDPTLEPPHIACIGDAFAAPGIALDPADKEALFTALRQAALRQLSSFKPCEIALLSHAFTQCNRVDPPLFAAFEKQTIFWEMVSPSDIAMLARAFALRYSLLAQKNPDTPVPEALFIRLAGFAAEQLKLFSPEELGHFIRALAIVQLPSPILLDQIVTTILVDLPNAGYTYGGNDFATFAWAFASLKSPNPRLFACIANWALHCTTWSAQDLTDITWAFATVHLEDKIKYRPLFQRLAEQTLRVLSVAPGISAEHLNIIVWAFSSVGLRHNTLFNAIMTHATGYVAEFSADHMLRMLQSFVHLNASATLQLLDAFLPPLRKQLHRSRLNNDQIAHLVWILSCAKRYDKDLFSDLNAQLASRNTSEWSDEAISLLAASHFLLSKEAPGILSLPPALLAKISALVGQLQPPSSALHRSIAHHLQSIKPGFKEGLFFAGYFIDIAYPAEKLAIEIQDSSRFLHDLASTKVELCGEDQMFKEVLVHAGWKMVEIPHFVWETKSTSEAAQASYIRELLDIPLV